MTDTLFDPPVPPRRARCHSCGRWHTWDPRHPGYGPACWTRLVPAVRVPWRYKRPDQTGHDLMTDMSYPLRCTRDGCTNTWDIGDPIPRAGDRGWGRGENGVECPQHPRFITFVDPVVFTITVEKTYGHATTLVVDYTGMPDGPRRMSVTEGSVVQIEMVGGWSL